MTVRHPYDVGSPRVTPSELVPGRVYDTPMGAEGPVLIVSVGPRWITFRQQEGWSGARGWGAKRRLLRSGWEGPYFHESDVAP